MAITYGTRTAFSLASNLASLASNNAKPLGKVDNSSALDFAFFIELEFTTGTPVADPKVLEVFLITAASDTSSTYTDAINPASTSDVASSIKNAAGVFLARADASSTLFRAHFVLDLGHPWPFWTLVPRNSSGVALSASGYAAHYTPIKY